MDSAVIVALITAIAGLLTGAVSWGIEKRRSQRTERLRLLAEWRAGIHQAQTEAGEEGNVTLAQIAQSSWYLSLRARMTEHERYLVEPPPSTFIVWGDRDMHSLAGTLASAVDRIEKSWRLP